MQTKREMSPEEKKAYQDSVRQVYENKLRLYWSLGYEHFKQSNWQKAKKYFRQIAELDTTGIYSKVLYQRLGTCYLNQQPANRDSAEWAYEIGLKRLPDTPYFYTSLGYIYRTTPGREEKAIQTYQKLTELEPDSSSHYSYLGEIYYNIGELEQAIKAYSTAIELDPDNKTIQEIRNKILDDYGSIDEQIQNLENMIAKFPDDMAIRIDLVNKYFEMGEYEKSVDQLKVVTIKEPGNLSALELLGEAYNGLKQYKNAITTYKKIIEIQPDDNKNICNIAMNYSLLGKHTTGLSYIRKALLIDSKYGLAYITRGMIYETAADKCKNQREERKTTFDDKLVYKIAYDEYTKATKDPFFKGNAQKKMTYLENFIPQKGDYFMHPGQTEPMDPCYDWIQ
jgi:tetratricopeptide (TPR) repeat protein